MGSAGANRLRGSSSRLPTEIAARVAEELPRFGSKAAQPQYRKGEETSTVTAIFFMTFSWEAGSESRYREVNPSRSYIL